MRSINIAGCQGALMEIKQTQCHLNDQEGDLVLRNSPHMTLSYIAQQSKANK